MDKLQELILGQKGEVITLLDSVGDIYKKVGQAAEGARYFSSSRAAGDLLPAKITAFATALDAIVIAKDIKVSVLTSGTSYVYVVEQRTISGKCEYVKLEQSAITCSAEKNATLICVAILARELYEGIDKVLLGDYFRNVCDSIVPSTPKRADAARSVVRICDYFNHSSLINEEFDVVESFPMEDEVKRGLDAGNLISLEIKDLPPLKARAKRKTTASKEDSPDVWLNRAIAGEFKIERETPEELKPFIVSRKTLENYVATPVFKKCLKVVYSTMKAATEAEDAGITDFIPEVSNILLYGAPSSGKTRTMRAVAAALGVPCIPIVGNKYTEEGVVQGVIVNRNGEFVCVDTPFLMGYAHYCVIVLEELNTWSPNVAMGVLSQALEDPCVVYRNGLELVHRNPGCFVSACINPNAEGTEKISTALQSRFRLAFHTFAPERKKFIAIIAQDYPEKISAAEYVYEYYQKLCEFTKSLVDSQELADVVSLRSCQGAMWYASLENFSDLKGAIQDAMVSQITARVPELEDTILDGLKKFKEYVEI